MTVPLARISEAERRMTETVQLLLMLAREEGRNAHQEHVVLAPLVEAAVLAASDRFDGRDRAVAVDIPAAAAASLNRAGFLMILDNLISNAFQHAPASALLITLEDYTLTIVSGAANAGQPFVRGPDSEGAGLGLSIVQRLCARDDIPLSLGISEQGTIVRLGLRCCQST
ncbi:sensor protein QseC [compost metagenome]